MGRWLRRLGSLALGSVLALGLLEGWLRSEFNHDLHAVHVPGTVLELQPELGNLYGIEGTTVQSINSLGLRGRERSASDLRSILCVGGSTTACEYLSDGETWPDLLAEAVEPSVGGPVWVGNAGASGHRALDHVTALGKLLDQTENLDLVVVLAGINDASHAVLHEGTPPAEPHPGSAEQLRRVFAVLPSDPGLWPPDRTAIAAWLRRQKRRSWDAAALEDIAARSYSLRREIRAEAAAFDGQVRLSEEARRTYREHLAWTVGAIKRRGATPVLATQPTLWRAQDAEALERCWFGWVGSLPWEHPKGYVGLGAMQEILDEFNAATREVAASEGSLLVDLAALLDGDPEVFYDDCHFTEAGAHLVAAEMARVIAAGDPHFNAK